MYHVASKLLHARKDRTQLDNISKNWLNQWPSGWMRADVHRKSTHTHTHTHRQTHTQAGHDINHSPPQKNSSKDLVVQFCIICSGEPSPCLTKSVLKNWFKKGDNSETKYFLQQTWTKFESVKVYLIWHQVIELSDAWFLSFLLSHYVHLPPFIYRHKEETKGGKRKILHMVSMKKFFFMTVHWVL